MQKSTIIFGIIIMISLLNITNAERRKRYSNDLFQQRLLDLLLEAKRHGLLDLSEEREKEQSRKHIPNYFNDDDNYRLTHSRRKVVGLGDDPFKR